MSAVARAFVLPFTLETHSRCADAVEDHEWGTLLLSPSLDAVWSVNGLVAHEPLPGLTLDDLDALFTERFPGGRFVSATFGDPDTGARLEAQARERGWKVEHEVLMVLTREPDRVVDTSAVRAASREETLALMARWIAEDFSEQGEEAMRQIEALAEREWDARDTRAFVAGDASATCKLWSDGTTAQVEDVYTAPDARGGGHARALVSHAAGVARAEDHGLVFIGADDDDTPKELYHRLGFDPIARLTRIVRETPRA